MPNCDLGTDFSISTSLSCKIHILSPLQYVFGILLEQGLKERSEVYRSCRV